FVHQTLRGNGSITARVTSLTGLVSPNGGIAPGPNPERNFARGIIQPWAKAGVIIENRARQGSAYAAMMVPRRRGGGVAYDYPQDTPGLPGAVSAASQRWLRLVRAGDTPTGYDSADGTRWTRVGTASLAGLPAAVQVGLFVTSPPSVSGESSGPTAAAAVFDHVSMPGGRWRGQSVGASGQNGAPPGGVSGPAARSRRTGPATSRPRPR